MAETVYVLLKADQYKDMSLEDIHDELINSTLFDTVPGVFDWFSLWDAGNNSVSGKDNPMEITLRVMSLHDSAVLTMKKAEQKFAAAMQKHGASCMTDLVLDDIVRSEVSQTLWEYRSALCMMTGKFTYGHDFLFIDEDCSLSTFLDNKTLNDVKDHPEDYVLIECLYH